MKKLSYIIVFTSVFLVAAPVGAYSPQWFNERVPNYEVPTRNRQTVRMTYSASTGLSVEGKQVTPARTVRTTRQPRPNATIQMPREWPSWIGLPSWWE